MPWLLIEFGIVYATESNLKLKATDCEPNPFQYFHLWFLSFVRIQTEFQGS